MPEDGGVAQLGEHLLCKQGVIGSIPFTSTSRGQQARRVGRGGAGGAGSVHEKVEQKVPGGGGGLCSGLFGQSGIGCSLTIGKK